MSDGQAELMRRWAALRDWRNWDDDDKSRDFGRRLGELSDWRRSLLAIERSVVVSMRNEGDLTEDVLREMQHDLDLEEALLERRSQAVGGHLAELPDEDHEDGRDPDDPADRFRLRDAPAAADAVDAAGVLPDGHVSDVLVDEQAARAGRPVAG